MYLSKMLGKPGDFRIETIYQRVTVQDTGGSAQAHEMLHPESIFMSVFLYRRITVLSTVMHF